MPAMLELEQVSKRYAAVGAEASALVLDRVDLAVQAGEMVAVTGPSGSGKSTLLNVIGGLERPGEGHVRLEGVDLARLGERALARVRNRRIGFVFQAHHLLPQCTALENVLVPTLAGCGHMGRHEAVAAARRLLERVGLGDRLHHRPGQLSGGQCQRVAVVRALINRPALVLADEPTGSLDRAAADALADLLVELNRQEQVTLIVATHAQWLSARMGRRLALRDGQLDESGPAH